MILKELSRILVEELGARRLVPGDDSRPVRGLAVEEPVGDWLVPGEVAVTFREALDDGFLKSTGEAGSPAVVWRSRCEPPPEATQLAAALGLGLFVVPPEVPLRRLLSAFSDGDGLLLLSHSTGRTLLESAGAEASIGGLTTRVSELLGRPVVVEDPVGRLISSSPAAGPERPVTTTMTSRGNETVTFLRLCSRAPRTTIWLSAIFVLPCALESGQVYGPL